MALEDIYPKGERIKPLYSEQTDKYLQDLQSEDTFNAAEKLAQAGEGEIRAQILDAVADEVRRIEVARRKIGYLASVAGDLVGEHANRLATLPSQEVRSALHDLADRVTKAEIAQVKASAWD